MAEQTACHHCGSTELYVQRVRAAGQGINLLPGIGGFFHSPSLDVYVCVSCGFMHFFVPVEDRGKVKIASTGWRPLVKFEAAEEESEYEPTEADFAAEEEEEEANPVASDDDDAEDEVVSFAEAPPLPEQTEEEQPAAEEEEPESDLAGQEAEQGPADPTMPTVFVSFNNNPAGTYGSALVQALRAEGCRVYESKVGSIEVLLEKSDVFVCVIDRGWESSTSKADEAYRAFRRYQVGALRGYFTYNPEKITIRAAGMKPYVLNELPGYLENAVRVIVGSHKPRSAGPPA